MLPLLCKEKENLSKIPAAAVQHLIYSLPVRQTEHHYQGHLKTLKANLADKLFLTELTWGSYFLPGSLILSGNIL